MPVVDSFFFLTRVGNLWDFSALTPSYLSLCRSCVCCHGSHEFICASALLCLKDVVFSDPSITSDSDNLSIPLLHRPLSPEGWYLMEMSHLGLSARKFLTPHTLPSCEGSLCVHPHLLQEEASLMLAEQDTDL